MAIPRFFERTYAAVGKALSVSRSTLEEVLRTTVVGVACGPRCESSQNGRWIAELSVNLLARMYPEIAISGPPGLVADLRQLVGAINPEATVADSIERARITICVGDVSVEPTSCVFAGASGWVAHVESNPAPLGSANPYSSAAAACLAVSRVFREVFAARLPVGPLTERDTNVSLLDFGSSQGAELELGSVDVGEFAMFGLGAVANGALWALARHRTFSGRGWLVDPENIELSNLQRYVLTTDSDVGRSKTDIALGAMRTTSVDLRPSPQRLESFADTFGDMFPVPTVLVSVDDVAGRRATQALLPRLVINGWTGEGALGASWHVFDRDAACLACLYQPTRALPSQTEIVAAALNLPHMRAAMLWITRAPPSESEFASIATHLGLSEDAAAAWRGRPINELYRDLVCGSVALDVRGIGRLETVPLAHQSALAGVLAAAELVKRSDPALADRAQAEPLVVWDDVLRPPPTHWIQPRPRAQGCFCGDADYRHAFAAKWFRPQAP